VHCLHRKPAVTNRTLIPGVRSRYDDLVGIHLFQTDFVHSSGLFLPFHRYYVHLYEKALREECGYRGAQPYWDWTLWYDDPRRAPLFNGSPWSMGSNGKYIPDRNDTLIDIVPGFPPFLVAPATGGGCIERGPFTEQLWKAHIGPVGIRPQGPQGGLEYNPRCLKRDLSPIWSQDTRPTNASKLLNCPDLACVNEVFDAPQGIHGSGHFQIGGEELDVYVSPNDPIFWLHHAQVDRLWSIWQGLDIQNRTNQVWGTVTTFNGEYLPSMWRR
jgi:Common central domain of tyrosinase.